MREILFRGKRMNNGEWVHGSYAYQYGCHQILLEQTDGEYGFDNYHVDPDTVGQFTGLTDKNGKKIFEGDIVKCRHRVVRFYLEDIENINPRRSYGKETEENDSYGFSCFYWRNYAVSFRDGCIRIQNGSDHHEIRANYIYNHAIEVIGNIHDNSELMEGGVEDGK